MALEALIHIHCNASGFLINEANVMKNHINIKNNTTPHPIANFLKEKLFFAHFFTSVGLFTCT
ncbi:hypothetical protein IKO50_06160 [bacterium]|nr:hypothetical protein [bacterium]